MTIGHFQNKFSGENQCLENNLLLQWDPSVAVTFGQHFGCYNAVGLYSGMAVKRGSTVAKSSFVKANHF